MSNVNPLHDDVTKKTKLKLPQAKESKVWREIDKIFKKKLKPRKNETSQEMIDKLDNVVYLELLERDLVSLSRKKKQFTLEDRIEL